MSKREWGRRRSDNQPYPKTRGKEHLPTGLTPVGGTGRNPASRERRVTIDYLISQHNVGGVALCGWEFDVGESFIGGGHRGDVGKKLSKDLMSHLLEKGYLRIVKDPWIEGSEGEGTFEENPGAYQLIFTESGRKLYGLDYIELDPEYGEIDVELSRAKKMERVMDSIERFEHEKWEIEDSGRSGQLSDRLKVISDELGVLIKEKVRLRSLQIE